MSLEERLRELGVAIPEGTGLLEPESVPLGTSFSLGDLNVSFIAYDSLGVRSMATLVSTPEVNVFIDPSAALGPSRYGLPPHPLEERMLQLALKLIADYLKDVEVVIITHYHFDHHSPDMRDLYREKRLIVKAPEVMINKSQRERAKALLNDVEYEVGDGREFRFGRTLIKLSEPIPHGPSSRLGYVLEVAIVRGEDKLLFTSDVQGFLTPESLNLPLKLRPQLIIADGPPTYMLGTKFSARNYESFKKSVKKLMEELSGDLRWLVLDHHLLRDKYWRRRIADVIVWAEERGVELLSVPQLLHIHPNTMEALRRELYRLEGE